MVRVGGLGYRIDVTKPQGERISDMTLLTTGEAIDPGAQLRRRRLGQRQRGHRRPADLGRGRGAHPQARHRHGRAQHQRRRSWAPEAPRGKESPAMTDTPSLPKPSRRAFLRGTAMAAGALAAGRARGRRARPADHRGAALGAGLRRRRGCGALRDAHPLRGPRRAPQRRVADGGRRSRRSTSRRSTRSKARSRRRAAPSSGTIPARSNCRSPTTG